MTDKELAQFMQQAAAHAQLVATLQQSESRVEKRDDDLQLLRETRETLIRMETMLQYRTERQDQFLQDLRRLCEEIYRLELTIQMRRPLGQDLLLQRLLQSREELYRLETTFQRHAEEVESDWLYTKQHSLAVPTAPNMDRKEDPKQPDLTYDVFGRPTRRYARHKQRERQKRKRRREESRKLDEQQDKNAQLTCGCMIIVAIIFAAMASHGYQYTESLRAMFGG